MKYSFFNFKNDNYNIDMINDTNKAKNDKSKNEINILNITSPSFTNNGKMPKKHTGFGEDISPAFYIEGLSDNTVSIAITMDDLDIPFVFSYPHWLIWNIPKSDTIQENIPYGKIVESLNNATQGIAYGVNRYRGPKQPFFVRNTHRYKFSFYALDTFLSIDYNSNKQELLNAMEGHILAKGFITGTYKRSDKNLMY